MYMRIAREQQRGPIPNDAASFSSRSKQIGREQGAAERATGVYIEMYMRIAREEQRSAQPICAAYRQKRGESPADAVKPLS